MIYGRIYLIYCNETGECYYGSTELTIEQRLSLHIRCYKGWKKEKANYTTSFRIIERGNFSISLMEEGEFENTTAMEKRERHYIENNECVNNNIPTRTRKEWYEANIEQILEQHREYHQSNRENNLEKMKKWYEANKERILEQRKQKITCECGSVFRRADKAQHLKTKNHLAYIAKINI